MGFENNTIRLLIKSAEKFNIDFTDSLTIGRQALHIDESLLKELLKENNIPIGPEFFKNDGYCEVFLKSIGAKIVDSMDASSYENASIIHDMNTPVPDVLKNKYSCVIDGGTLEHVFNFPQALKNCMEMVKPNGYFITITPSNNFFGHGFYQFSPELFYRVFNQHNGFKMINMYFFTEGINSTYYEVADPEVINGRTTLVNSKPSYLFVIAQKIESKKLFEVTPMQSDYVNIEWKGDHTFKNEGNSGSNISMIKIIKLFLPSKIKTLLALLFRPTGISNQGHFKKINNDEI